MALVTHERKASTSLAQRHLQIGYNGAACLIDRMESEGVISQADHLAKMRSAGAAEAVIRGTLW